MEKKQFNATSAKNKMGYFHLGNAQAQGTLAIHDLPIHGAGNEMPQARQVEEAILLAGGIKRLAQLTGVSERTVYAWKNGTRYPRRKNMLYIERIIKNYNYDQNSWLIDKRQHTRISVLPRTNDSQDIQAPQNYKIRQNNAELMLIHFHQQQNSQECSYWPFHHEWLLTRAKSLDELCLYAVAGRAMEPVFSAGDICLVDCLAKDLQDDKVYLLRVQEALYLRRFFLTPDKWHFRCDCRNFAYQDIDITQKAEPKDWEIIGTVVWVGKNV